MWELQAGDAAHREGHVESCALTVRDIEVSNKQGRRILLGWPEPVVWKMLLDKPPHCEDQSVENGNHQAVTRKVYDRLYWRGGLFLARLSEIGWVILDT